MKKCGKKSLHCPHCICLTKCLFAKLESYILCSIIQSAISGYVIGANYSCSKEQTFLLSNLSSGSLLHLGLLFRSLRLGPTVKEVFFNVFVLAIRRDSGLLWLCVGGVVLITGMVE